MTKVALFGKQKDQVLDIVRACGLEIVESSPELVISYGGDGTLMHAEYAFPGVPKVLLKNSAICKKCSRISNEEVLERVVAGKYRVEEMMKLDVAVGAKRLWAMNDVILHNADPRHAIRYSLRVGDRELGENIIGDGIVVATPFGSTAYYRSITDSSFEVGIGLAFNNSTEQSDHLVLDEASVITARITRGPAQVYADNQAETIEVKEDEEVVIKLANDKTRIVDIRDGLR
jgi:NAD+ kinase